MAPRRWKRKRKRLITLSSSSSDGDQRDEVKDEIGHTPSANSSASDTLLDEDDAVVDETENQIWFVLNNPDDKHISHCKPCQKYVKKMYKGDLSQLKTTILLKCVTKRKGKGVSHVPRHSTKQVRGSFDDEMNNCFMKKENVISNKEPIKRIKMIFKSQPHLERQLKYDAIASNEIVVDETSEDSTPMDKLISYEVSYNSSLMEVELNPVCNLVDKVAENSSPMDIEPILTCNQDEPKIDKVSEYLGRMEDVELVPASNIIELNEQDALRRLEAQMSNKSTETNLGSISESSVSMILKPVSITEHTVSYVSTHNERMTLRACSTNASGNTPEAAVLNLSREYASGGSRIDTKTNISTEDFNSSSSSTSASESASWNSTSALESASCNSTSATENASCNFMSASESALCNSPSASESASCNSTSVSESSDKTSTRSVTTLDVTLHLGLSGAVDPYENWPCTCRLFSKKTEEKLSQIDSDLRNQRNRPKYVEIPPISQDDDHHVDDHDDDDEDYEDSSDEDDDVRGGEGNDVVRGGKGNDHDDDHKVDYNVILNTTWKIEKNRKFNPRIPEKSEHELKIFECEDLMSELDVSIHTAESAYHRFRALNERLSNTEISAKKYIILPRDIYGGSSVLYWKPFEQLFGDKCADYMLKVRVQPFETIPFLLNLLQRQINQLKSEKWLIGAKCHEVLKECYPKSLDHHSITFRQFDRTCLRPKYLEDEIKTIYNKRVATTHGISNDYNNQSDLVLIYMDRKSFHVAADLIINYINKHDEFDIEEKLKAEHIIYHVIPDIFAYKRTKLDELVDEDEYGCDSGNVIALAPNFSQSKDQNMNILSDDNQKVDGSYTVFFGNNPWYIFLRLHHILCNRLSRLYNGIDCITLPEENDIQIEMYRSAGLKLIPKDKINKCDIYKKFLEELKNLLNGSINYNLYEEKLGKLFGVNAYVGYTMDILISNVADQILHLTRNKISKNCIKLMYQHANNGGSGGPPETLFQRKEVELIHEAMAKHELSETTSYKIVLYNDTKMKLIIKTLERKKNTVKSKGKGKCTKRKA